MLCSKLSSSPCIIAILSSLSCRMTLRDMCQAKEAFIQLLTSCYGLFSGISHSCCIVTSKVIKSRHMFCSCYAYITCILSLRIWAIDSWTGLSIIAMWFHLLYTRVCFSPIVGLDLQQKVNVYYSGARRFGTDIPHGVSCDRSGQRPLHSAVKPQSIHQAATSISASEQGT